MGTPTPQELALQAEVRQLRERIAKLEQGRQPEAGLVGEGDLQSLARIRVPAQESNARHTGITVIGDVPWGTHFCQFYQDKQDLIDILVSYFKAGLENNEFCMWVTSEPLASAEAKAALAANVENLDSVHRRRAIGDSGSWRVVHRWWEIRIRSGTSGFN